jgi:hypothetical protein
VKGITLKKRLLKWKQSQIYVLVGKVWIRIMQQEHDVLLARQHGEQTTRVAIGERFY